MAVFTVLADFRAGLRIRLRAAQKVNSDAYGSNLQVLVDTGLLVIPYMTAHDPVIERFLGFRRQGSFFQMMLDAGLLPAVSAPRLITQPTWFVNADTGDDMNSGETASSALRTLPGATSAWSGGIFEQPTTVEISGDHSGESLTGGYQLANAGSLVFNAPTTELDTDAITSFTAENAGADETSLLTVTGKDWTTSGPGGTSLIDKRIRMTSGPANGNMFFILTEDPDGAGTDTVRVSRVGRQTTLLTAGVTYVDPVAPNTFVVEDLVMIGGVDMAVLQGRQASAAFTGRNVQFNDLRIGLDFSTSKFRLDTPLGVILNGCDVVARIGGSSTIDAMLTRYAGITIRQGSLLLEFNGCYISGGFLEVSFVNGLAFIDCVFQSTSLVARIPNLLLGGNNSFFDVLGGPAITVGNNAVAGLTKFDLGGSALFGSGNDTLGIQIDSGCQMIIDSVLPTLSGPVNAISIGGTDFTTYAAAVAASPTNGAGIFER